MVGWLRNEAKITIRESSYTIDKYIMDYLWYRTNHWILEIVLSDMNNDITCLGAATESGNTIID